MPKAEPGTGLAFLLSKRSDLPSLIRALVKLESRNDGLGGSWSEIKSTMWPYSPSFENMLYRVGGVI